LFPCSFFKTAPGKSPTDVWEGLGSEHTLADRESS
jgi:hypothetical protein